MAIQLELGTHLDGDFLRIGVDGIDLFSKFQALLMIARHPRSPCDLSFKQLTQFRKRGFRPPPLARLHLLLETLLQLAPFGQEFLNLRDHAQVDLQIDRRQAFAGRFVLFKQ